MSRKIFLKRRFLLLKIEHLFKSEEISGVLSDFGTRGTSGNFFQFLGLLAFLFPKIIKNNNSTNTLGSEKMKTKI